MNILAILPPREFNLGNGIFADGGVYLLEKFFPDDNIFFVEYFQSCHFGQRRNPTPPFTPSTLGWAKKDCDLIVFFGGCSVSVMMWENFYKHILDLGVPFVGWGLGSTKYNDEQKAVGREIAKRSLITITRDKYLFDVIRNHGDALSGLDGGFFCNDYYKVPTEKGGYAISNIDSQGQLCIKGKPSEFNCGNVMEEANNLTKYSDEVYVVSNNSNLLLIPDVHGFIQITTSPQLWSIYKNADIVATTRAHTTVCCLTEGTKVIYHGWRDKRALGMFEQFDIDVTIPDLDPEENKLKIEKGKKDYLIRLEEVLKSLKIKC